MIIDVKSLPPIYDGILKDFKNIVETLKEYLEVGYRIAQEKESQLEVNRKKYSESEDGSNSYYLYNDEYESIKNRFLSDAFLKSALMYLCSQFEIKIRDICVSSYCVYFDESINGDKMFEDIKKKRPGITDYATLLETKEEINYNFKDHKNWPEIEDFIEIRNLIVHWDGYVNKINREKFQTIQRKYKNYIQYHEPSETIIISKELLIKFSEILMAFLNETIKELYDKCPKK
ncbi:MAG TPA: hypothetical protein PKW80_08660 [Bacteroidales bacterium]|nr:hypothetical protein [Bacteroidales bacterium]